MRIIWRVLRWLLVTVLVLVLVLPLVLLGLAGTEGGSRWLIQQGLRAVPGDAALVDSQGSILRGLHLTGLHLALDAATIDIDDLRLQVAFRALTQRRVLVRELAADGVRVQVHPQPDSEPPPPAEPFDFNALPDIELPVDIALPAVSVTALTVTLPDSEPLRFDAIRLAANTDRDRLHLQQLQVVHALGQATLSGNIGTHHPYPLDAWLDVDGTLPAVAQQWLGSDAPLQADLRLLGSLRTLELRQRLRSPATLTLEGQLSPFEPSPAAELSAQWQPLTLHPPPAEDGSASAPIQLGAGQLTLSGTLDAYQLSLRTQADTAELPTLRVQADAEGSLSGLAPLHLALNTELGNAELHGSVNWEAPLQWDLTLLSKGFDPGVLVPQLPGRLNLNVHSSGQFDDQGLRTTLRLTELSGQLRRQPLSGGGQLALTLAPGALPAAEGRLTLRAGANRAVLSGQAGSQNDLRLQLDGAALSALWPGLGGRLHADLALRGTLERPRLTAQVNGQQLVLDALRLEQITLDSNLSLHGDVRLTLTTSGLQEGDTLLLDQGRVTLDGSVRQHRLAWQLAREQERTQGELDGSLRFTGNLPDADSRWQGQLTRWDIDSALAGRWQLREPVALHASAKTAGLAPLCLGNDDGALCANADWNADGRTQAKLQIDDFPLSWARRVIPESTLRLDGALSLLASFEQQRDQRQGNVALTVTPGALWLDSGTDADHRLSWEQISVTATLDGDRVDAHADVGLPGGDGLQARVATGLSEQAPLDGELSLRLTNFSAVEIFVPQVRQVAGQLGGRLRLGGTLGAPRFEGELGLRDGTAEVPDLGITLTALTFAARADQDGALRLRGSVKSGDGELVLGGYVDAKGAMPWPVYLTVSGNRFLAVQRPEAEVLIAPELEIRLEGLDLQVRGRLTVPRAAMTLRSLPQSAVSVSRDEDILYQEQDDSGVLRTDIQVTVVLGDEITFDGFGLSARFGGELKIVQQPERTPRLTGEIRIVEGRFKAYGQNLKVEHGVLIFQGPPDNPGLDIRAVRTVTLYNVRAGIQLGGTLQDPRSKVFSEPDMEETEAMAYLLTGRPLNHASDNDTAAIMQAIALWGIERGEFITDRLGNTLGLEIGVDTEGEFEDTALMLGKQLSARLYLRYSVGLFEALSTVMLRYTLTRSLSLETRSNAREQSIDLIYRHER
ncbi:translocation/assembly module TamB domain-containing protein [Isoalcanivorax beigongshangi]|uniref:Translocation/assembly module TamB domain-containing protein n=1 Tax=Isoalcanivorax beigongshangi TaxID=3238810 RepID=A0ABV4AIF5_9GAMM